MSLHDALCRKVSLWLQDRAAVLGRELIKALQNSNRTCKEVMTFPVK